MYQVEAFRSSGGDLIFRRVYLGPDVAEAVAVADDYRRQGFGYLITEPSGSVRDAAAAIR